VGRDEAAGRTATTRMVGLSIRPGLSRRDRGDRRQLEPASSLVRSTLHCLRARDPECRRGSAEERVSRGQLADLPTLSTHAPYAVHTHDTVTGRFVGSDTRRSHAGREPPPLLALVLRATLHTHRPLTSTFSNGQTAFLGRFSRSPISNARHCIGQVARLWRPLTSGFAIGRPNARSTA
jgi:hypothetical protein